MNNELPQSHKPDIELSICKNVSSAGLKSVRFRARVNGACRVQARAGCRPRFEKETALLWLLAHSNRSSRIHIWYASGHLGNALKKEEEKEIWSVFSAALFYGAGVGGELLKGVLSDEC